METPTEPVAQAPEKKQRKKREMTPELLEKLKMARERAAELRNMAKDAKAKLPPNIPEKEKSKVAQYLATRKAIKEKIKQEIVEEIEKGTESVNIPVGKTEVITEEHTDHPIDEKGYMLPMPKEEGPPLPKETPKPKPKVKPPPEPESSSDEEYTTIKIPKKKIVKWEKRLREPEKAPQPVIPEKPKDQFYGSFGTQHLVNLARTGYSFKY
jgi:hypothetical protein